MKPITYKGYQASVEWEDGSLFIKVLHIDDLLLAECESAAEVEACARALIDDYIETCAEEGREPQKPFKGSFNVRMEPELHRRAAMAAADLSMSLNAWICLAATEKLQCNGIAERFDGVFSKKRQEMSVYATVQLLQAQQNFDPITVYNGLLEASDHERHPSYLGEIGVYNTSKSPNRAKLHG
ncbi:type II toxin-antitoxin system HicB family antitoxin [Agrobacterium rosae]|uniref:type II toxin-antitoxin system HicB family antitoxin n=1 Tax=Agrobacterium rosae TaxID=1972867 RepID=UPI00203499BF|nr:type II toxin-antitoxin system HicB family antitoxin [Agrobacterium rosae]MCM2434157.1 type II toxin-antitoxin system HicB family antitoxin [Agrobacterium rosae]